MLRRPLVLAALAHSAVPRLHPVSVHGTTTRSGAHYQVARIVTDDGRAWDVKVALSAAAGAALEQSDALTRLLAKRLPYAVPRLEGLTVTPDGDTVAVLPHLPGEATTWRTLEAGSPLARGIGKALAVLHDIDPRVVEESGLPTYDADAYRARKLAGLDRAATTGHVPAGLLGRWERALEEVTLWKFATCTTHGPLESADVLVDGDVTAIIGWEQAGVSDPAEDFAPLSVLAPPAAFDTAIESYAGARRDAPDPHLTRRIHLAAELQRVNALMDAVAADDDQLVHRRAAALRRLDEETQGDDSLMPSTPGRRRPTGEQVQQDAVDPADIRVVDVNNLGDEDETVEIPLHDDADAPKRSTGSSAEKQERVARTPQPSKKPLPDEATDDASDADDGADAQDEDAESSKTADKDTGSSQTAEKPDDTSK